MKSKANAALSTTYKDADNIQQLIETLPHFRATIFQKRKVEQKVSQWKRERRR